MSTTRSAKPTHRAIAARIQRRRAEILALVDAIFPADFEGIVTTLRQVNAHAVPSGAA
ncbi:hypothetical protein [Blastococcus sp. Marseille-P5729]|uniref:hypothetical protein n=1 Tax=Blastococcus sp. Marseille-P5729 TaxID=2086582 RepID=UPI00131B489F|nr:hypothetical protein [Blastococcus sp. Marseille-P5729]